MSQLLVPRVRRDESGSDSESSESSHDRKKKRKRKEKKSKKEKKERKKEKKKKKRESERSVEGERSASAMAAGGTSAGATATSAAAASVTATAAPLHRAMMQRPINPMLGFMRPLSTGFLGDRAGQMAGRGFSRSNAYQPSGPTPVLSNLEQLSREADEAERDAKRARRKDPMAQLEQRAAS